MSAALEVEDLVTEIDTEAGRVRPVDGVSFTLGHAETVCLVGESGCGKSMLALSLMRVLPPGARLVGGSVRLEDGELTALSDERMRAVRGSRMAMVPQDPMTAFDPLYAIGDQIMEAIRAHEKVSKDQARERMLTALGQVRLPDPPRIARALPSELSGGMNQRCMIAMALACDPVVLLADEPTTALDVTVQAQVLELLAQLQRRYGLAILLITHDMGVAARVADRIAVMYAGRIVEEGPARTLFARPRHPYTRGLIRSAREAAQRGRHHSIPGAPPNLLALPEGCAFGPRCAHVHEACRAAVPSLRDFGEARAACVLEDAEREWLEAARTSDAANG